MFGNKYAVDELALNFKNSIDKLNKINKSNHSEIKKAAKDHKVHDAADYLMEKTSDAEDMIDDALDSSLKDMAGDQCNACGYAHDAKDGCGSHASDIMSNTSDAATQLQALDPKSAQVVSGLSKIAKKLVNKGKHAEAAVVLKTANEIRSEAKQKNKKAYVVAGLSKIAKGLISKGRENEAAMVLSTANEIKNEKVAKKVATKTASKVTKATPKVAAKPSAPDYNFLVDKKVEFVISELGKVAGQLRSDGNRFAADMVEVTASDIKNEALVKAAKKLETISELQKMAAEAKVEGDDLAAGIIKQTINNVKRS